MHHNAQTIQTIEALIRLARGTLNADGIAELRNQLAPHEQAALYWSDSRTVKSRNDKAIHHLVAAAAAANIHITVGYNVATEQWDEVAFKGNDNRELVALVNQINKEF